MTHYGEIAAKIREKAIGCGRSPNAVTLIAVSKTFPVEKLQATYHEGCRDFGESRVQEGLHKIPLLPKDCRWHLIGTLQSNKVAKAISHFTLIHSVDTLELAEKISYASQLHGLTTSILLQVNTSGEKSKHGLAVEEWERGLEKINQLPHLDIQGLMTMAPLTCEERPLRQCFSTLAHLLEKWRKEMKDPLAFRHLSMGMSNDYLMAIEEGATLLRVGSAIFYP